MNEDTRARVKQAYTEVQVLWKKYPEVVAAGLIAAAVERRIISQEQAESYVRENSLSDLQSVVQALSRAVDRAGRRAELLDLVKEGRHVLKRAEGLLDLSERHAR